MLFYARESQNCPSTARHKFYKPLLHTHMHTGKLCRRWQSRHLPSFLTPFLHGPFKLNRICEIIWKNILSFLWCWKRGHEEGERWVIRKADQYLLHGFFKCIWQSLPFIKSGSVKYCQHSQLVLYFLVCLKKWFSKWGRGPPSFQAGGGLKKLAVAILEFGIGCHH